MIKPDHPLRTQAVIDELSQYVTNLRKCKSVSYDDHITILCDYMDLIADACYNKGLNENDAAIAYDAVYVYAYMDDWLDSFEKSMLESEGY